MRMLRSIYNRGVEAGVARFIPRLFRDVYTGVDVRQKKALPVSELHTLLYKAPQPQHLIRTQAIARLMFQFCGMPFSDFAHLEKSALEDGILRYNRIKTGTPISLEILDTSKKEINKLRNSNPPREDYPDYLFNIMRGDKRRKEEGIYKEYQSALRRFNNQLKSLSRELNLKSPVSSYTIRHSWATNAKYQGIPIEMISESLGHKSIKTTQTYLKGFGLKKRTEANQLNCFYVESYNTSHQ
jgi:Site-specific recombinase XerD